MKSKWWEFFLPFSTPQSEADLESLSGEEEKESAPSLGPYTDYTNDSFANSSTPSIVMGKQSLENLNILSSLNDENYSQANNLFHTMKVSGKQTSSGILDGTAAQAGFLEQSQSPSFEIEKRTFFGSIYENNSQFILIRKSNQPFNTNFLKQNTIDEDVRMFLDSNGFIQSECDTVYSSVNSDKRYTTQQNAFYFNFKSYLPNDEQIFENTIQERDHKKYYINNVYQSVNDELVKIMSNIVLGSPLLREVPGTKNPVTGEYDIGLKYLILKTQKRLIGTDQAASEFKDLYNYYNEYGFFEDSPELTPFEESIRGIHPTLYCRVFCIETVLQGLPAFTEFINNNEYLVFSEYIKEKALMHLVDSRAGGSLEYFELAKKNFINQYNAQAEFGNVEDRVSEEDWEKAVLFYVERELPFIVKRFVQLVKGMCDGSMTDRDSTNFLLSNLAVKDVEDLESQNKLTIQKYSVDEGGNIVSFSPSDSSMVRHGVRVVFIEDQKNEDLKISEEYGLKVKAYDYRGEKYVHIISSYDTTLQEAIDSGNIPAASEPCNPGEEFEYYQTIAGQLESFLINSLAKSISFRLAFKYSFDIEDLAAMITMYTIFSNGNSVSDRMFTGTKVAIRQLLFNSESDDLLDDTFEDCNNKLMEEDFWNSMAGQRPILDAKLILALLAAPLYIFKGWSKMADPHVFITQTIVELAEGGFLLPDIVQASVPNLSTEDPDDCELVDFPVYPGKPWSKQISDYADKYDLPLLKPLGLPEPFVTGFLAPVPGAGLNVSGMVTWLPAIFPPFAPYFPLPPFSYIYYFLVNPLLALLRWSMGQYDDQVQENAVLRSSLESIGLNVSGDPECEENEEVSTETDKKEDEILDICKLPQGALPISRGGTSKC